MQHQARKRFGQNFLHDVHVISDIIAAIGPQAGDNVVEIGPGLGALTLPLLQALPRLQVVELDRDLVARLQQQHSPERLVIHAGDALQFDFSSLGPKLRVVGNLPYNISSPLLFHLAQYASQVQDMHFMLQNEVVDRMTASPGSKDYGRLTVMLQYHFFMDKLFEVPPEAFRPAPKVTSAIVRMMPWPERPAPAADEDLLATMVAAAFGQRRKTLRNVWRDWLQEDDWAELPIDPMARPETLTLQAFVQAANHVHQRRQAQA